MNFKVISDIAQALLFARFKHTMIAAIGVTFSITMFITLLGFMSGLNEMLDGLILNRTPHIRIYNEIKPRDTQPIEEFDLFSGDYNMIRSVKPSGGRLDIYNNRAILEKLHHDPRVLGVAPKVTTQVFYNIGSIDLTGNINGVDVQAENKLFFFSSYVVNGNYLDLDRVPNSIILGKGAAEKMLALPGDVIRVTTVSGNSMQLKVVGYFQSGIQDVDKVQSYVSINTVQKLMGKTESYITDLQVKLHDLDQAPPMAAEYKQLFDTDTEDIQTANSQFETGTFVRTLISYAVGITLLIVAGFGIYNILNMMIYEKMDTIAILKATGFSGSDVRKIFLSIALTIGIAGSVGGIVFGYILSSIIDTIPFNTSALPTIETYPVSYNIKFYLIGISFGVLTTYLAGLLPARKASIIDPVVIIRGK